MVEQNNALLEKKNAALQCLREGRHREAKAMFEEVCGQDANDAGALYMLAIANAQLGDYPSAEAGMRRVIALMPQMADAHFILGQALQGQNRLGEAAASYRQAAALRPDMAEAHYSLGCVLHMQGNRIEALDCYQKALQIKPDYSDALANQATVLQELGRLDAAIASYRRALQLRPDNDYLRCALGVALVQQNNQDAGLGLLQEGLAIRPEKLDAMAMWKAGDRCQIDATDYSAPTQDAAGVVIATTLAPKNLDNQRAAVDSWKRLGFKVVSINSVDEIRQLQSTFTDVEFITARRDARNDWGKPYVYFDDFLAYFKTADVRICGIINSDIHLKGEHLRAIVSKEAMDAFLFGCRLDVAALGKTEGSVFRDGFDYFFFDRKYLDIYPPDEFCLGLPWWDYWAVLVPLIRQVPVKKLVAPVAIHITHPLNWDENNWKHLGCKVAEYVGMQRQPTVKMLGYCARYIVFLIEKYAQKICLADEAAA